VLAIESSCDETSVAVLDGACRVLGQSTHSQIALHRPYGGVVPELASRNHTLALPDVLESALAQAATPVAEIDVFAATAGPGLASALLVGNTTAKALALACNKPFLAINHLEGHLLSPFFGTGGIPESVVLVVSGGHTLLVHVRAVGDYQLLGRTRDDAAGEAFDKVGKMLGLPYPGGPEIDRMAGSGDPRAFDFPRSMIDSGDFDFSFSGLKTSVRVCLEKLEPEARARLLPDLCASFQAAVVEVLVAKSLAAAEHCGVRRIAAGGGVACNRFLRQHLADRAATAGLQVDLTTPDLATDNAAMIAFVARHRHLAGQSTPLDADIDPNLPLDGLIALRGARTENFQESARANRFRPGGL
jgi:N6-L-threonylcarbamoyladenine synthase